MPTLCKQKNLPVTKHSANIAAEIINKSIKI